MEYDESNAQELILYMGVRAIGHTYSMLHGAKNVDNVAIICLPSQRKEIMRECPKATVVTLSELHRLRGSRLPVLIDHTVLGRVLQGLLNRNAELQFMLDTKEK